MGMYSKIVFNKLDRYSYNRVIFLIIFGKKTCILKDIYLYWWISRKKEDSFTGK